MSELAYNIRKRVACFTDPSGTTVTAGEIRALLDENDTAHRLLGVARDRVAQLGAGLRDLRSYLAHTDQDADHTYMAGEIARLLVAAQVQP